MSLSHLLHSHCLVSSRTMLFFWVRDESWLHDKTSWWLWRRLARRFKSQRTVTEVLKMPLKVQGFSFSQCWPTKKEYFFPSYFKSHLQWLLLTFSMYTSCIVIAVEYNKLNVQKKIIYMNINDNFLSDLIFFKSLKFFFVGNKTRICKTIAITIGYYCCCIIFPLLHFIAFTF